MLHYDDALQDEQGTASQTPEIDEGGDAAVPPVTKFEKRKGGREDESLDGTQGWTTKASPGDNDPTLPVSVSGSVAISPDRSPSTEFAAPATATWDFVRDAVGNPDEIPSRERKATTRSAQKLKGIVSKSLGKKVVENASRSAREDGCRPSATSCTEAVAATQEASTGVPRTSGVWTRKRRWIRVLSHTKEAEDRVAAEEKRMGDRQRQRREDEVWTLA